MVLPSYDDIEKAVNLGSRLTLAFCKVGKQFSNQARLEVGKSDLSAAYKLLGEAAEEGTINPSAFEAGRNDLNRWVPIPLRHPTMA